LNKYANIIKIWIIVRKDLAHIRKVLKDADIKNKVDESDLNINSCIH
jgi:hypothetical protein